MNSGLKAILLLAAMAGAALAQPLTITSPQILQRGVQSVAYSQALTATGGTSPYTWDLVIGAGTGLPPGYGLAPNGTISGNTTSTGTFNFRATVTDISEPTPESRLQDFTLIINPTLVITTPSLLPAGVRGTPYIGATLASTGGQPAITWMLDPMSGPVPPGLTLNATTGTITGTPSTAGTYAFEALATDSATGPATQVKSQTFSITITEPPFEISTAASLPNARVGNLYSQPLTAVNGTPPYGNWTVIAGALPAGISLSPSTGVLSGTPATVETANFTVRVQDSTAPAQTVQKAFSLRVDPALLSITTNSPLPPGTVGALYTQVLGASGGVSPYVNWAVLTGSLPAGLTLSPTTGVISGTPAGAGTVNFTIQLRDSDSEPQIATKEFSLTINANVLTISTASPLPAGSLNTAYSQPLTAINGTQPYGNWLITAGALPAGVTLDNVNGLLSGTPTVSGPFNFTVEVRDSAMPQQQVASKAFSLTIGSPLLITTTSPLPPGTTGAAYSQTLAASGGTPPYTNWTVIAGALPQGLLLNSSTGSISGTPTAPGVASFTVQVQDSAVSAQTTSAAFSLTVNPGPLAITTASPLPAGTAGTPYAQPLAASGGTQPYVSWTVTSGSLPVGVSLNASTGVLSGTPTNSGSFSFTIQVRDSGTEQLTASKPFTLSVSPAPLVITTSNPLMSGNVNLPYSQALSASGGNPPYVNWSVAVGSGALPNGLGLNASTGVISGIPTIGGTFTFTIQVSDSSQTPVIASKVFTIEVGNGDFRITSVSPLNTGNVGGLYSQTLTATGGFPPYRNWTVISGSAPAGLTLNPASGAITGTPTAAGAYDFTVRVEDSSSNGSLQFAEKPFRLTILPGSFSITTASPLPNGTINTSYDQTFAAGGGALPHVNWVVSAGTLPSGLTLNGFTGQLNGIPSQSGTFNFTVQVQDSTTTPQVVSKAFSLTITGGPVIIITNSPLPAGNAGTVYSQTLAATGGTPPYSNWTVSSGSLPAGLTLNAATGVLSGTPGAAGSFSFTVRVQDSTPSSVPLTGSKQFALTINSPLAFSIVTASPLPNGSLANPYSQTLTATGGAAPFSSWIVTAGALPAGLSLNPASGVLSGTPTATGTFNFTAQVRDASSTPQFASKAFAVTILASSPVISTLSPLLSGSIAQPYTTSFSATGGTTPYTWNIATGTLPTGITLSSAGVLAGTTTQSGTFVFGVRVTDSTNLTDTKSYSLTINPFALVITTASPLPTGTVNAPYSQNFAVTGGSTPYSWAIQTGSLPGGLTLASSGLLSGTPTQSGTFDIVVRVTDGENFSAFKPFRVTIVPVVPSLTITTASPLPQGGVGLPYNLTFAATGSTSGYLWSLGEGSSLPPGLTLTAAGVLSGTPSAAGSYSFEVEVRGSDPASQQFATKTFTLLIQLTPLTITTATPLPVAAINAPYSQLITATGGAQPYVWQLVSGALPQGVTFSAAGLLSGTPTQSGPFIFTVRVRDNLLTQVDRTFTLPVDAGFPIITTGALPGGQALQTYSMQLTAVGGTPPYTWAIASGSLPSGFTLTMGGLILGTAGESVSASFAARVNDTAGRSNVKSFSLVIGGREEPTSAQPEIATVSLSDGTVGKIYGMQFAARNGSPPYRWSFSGLPDGIEGGPGGDIFGTPRRPGSFNVQVTVTDDSRGQATGFFTLVIQPGVVVIATERAPDGRVNDTYSTGFTATGGLPPYTFSVLSGSTPSGVSLATNGILAGVPDQTGTYQFNIQATDSLGEKGARGYTVAIKPPLISISTASLNNGFVGNAYNATLSATGGIPPYKWAATGLPDGLGIDQNTGAITGTPTKNGTFAVGATVSDQESQNASRSYTVEITTVLVITTPSVGNMVVGTPVSTALSATGGRLPYSWSLLGGSLPSGVSLGSDGVISGTPSAEGNSNFTVQVADANGITTSKSFSARVVAPLVITTQTLPPAPFGAAYSTSLAATGGVAPYQWSLASGSLPGGLQLSSAGAITGSPTAGGTFNFTVQAGDSATPQLTIQRPLSIQVSLPDVSGLIITLPPNPQPAQQPQITLQINSPYPVELTGTLVLTFAPNAANNADDPAIQFSTGGRSAPFTIPAGQTQAVFRVPDLAVQTGTTAGTITLTTSLTAAGSPVNCNCQLTQTIIIARSAPVITSLRLTRTANGFNVLVTGFSTSREVTQGTFRFAGGATLQTTELVVPLTAVFNAWFQSAASNSFGGQFSLTLPFTIQGDTSTVNSVTVTLTNGAGSSQPSTGTF